MNRALLLQIVRENRLLASSLAVLVVLCGIIWYLALHQSFKVADLQSSWHAKRRLAAIRSTTQRADQYLLDRDHLQQLYRTIPFRHEFPRVISEILDLMALRDAEPGPIQYKPGKIELNGLIAYTMNCSASGSYPGLKRLVADLEQLDGISTLDAISFATLD